MKLIKIGMTIVLSTMLITIVSAQKTKRALSIYKKLGYKASIPKFQEAEGLSIENMTKIANSYRLNHDTPNAEFWYSHVVKESNKAEDFLHYAQALQSNKNYDCLLYTSPSPRDRG